MKGTDWPGLTWAMMIGTLCALVLHWGGVL